MLGLSELVCARVWAIIHGNVASMESVYARRMILYVEAVMDRSAVASQ